MPLTAMDDDDDDDLLTSTPEEPEEEDEEDQAVAPEKPEPRPEREDEGDEGDEDDKEKMGRRAQKRINALLARSKAAEEKLRWFEEQQQDRDAQLEELRKRLEERDSKSSQGEYEKRRQEIRARKKQAIDDGDSDAQLAADEEMEKLRMEEAKRQWEARQKQPPARGAPPPTYVPPAEQAWQQKNSGWFTTQPDDQGRLPQEVLTAAQIYQTLESEGFDKDDDEFYEELDKRLHVIHPRLKPQTKPKPKSPVGAGSRTTTNVKKSTKFSEADKAAMEKYGFGNPDDPEDRKQWMAFKSGGGL